MPNWITTNITSGTGSQSILVTVPEYTGTTSRSGQITIRTKSGSITKTLSVGQNAYVPRALSVEPNPLIFSNAGPVHSAQTKTATITYQGRGSDILIASSDSNWLRPRNIAWTGDTAQFEVVADHNNLSNQREGNITLVSAGSLISPYNLTVEQWAYYYVDITSGATSIGENGGTTEWTLISNTSWEVELIESAGTGTDWVTVSPMTGTGNTTLSFTVDPNHATTERRVSVKITTTGTDPGLADSYNDYFRQEAHAAATGSTIYYTTTDGQAIPTPGSSKFEDVNGDYLPVLSNAYNSDGGTMVVSGELYKTYNTFNLFNTLETLSLPENVVELGGAMCYKASNLTAVTIPSTVTTIGNSCFSNTILQEVVLPTGLTFIGGTAFAYTQIKDISIPDGVTVIPDSTFAFCSSLSSITLSNNLTSIGAQAFYNCTALKEVVLPDSLTTIGASAFDGCEALSAITIPSGVTSIPDLAFDWCTGMKTVELPATITSIGTRAFMGNSTLNSFTIHATTPPSLGSSVFTAIYTNYKIYVPAASVNAYKSAPGWSDYASHIQAISE